MVKVYYSIITVTLILSLMLDLSIPLGVAVGVVYIIPVLLTLCITSKKSTYSIALLGVILTVAGFLYSPSGGELWKVLANRSLAIIAIMSIASAVIFIKRKQEELIEQTELAIQAHQQAIIANQAKENFLSSMSHEFNTPLNSVMGFSELLLQDDDLNAEQLESIQYIHTGGRNIKHLVETSLNFLSSQKDTLTTYYTSLSFPNLVTDALSKYEDKALENAISITSTIPKFPIKHIYSDLFILSTVFNSFLKNAIQYNTHQGSIELSCLIVEGGLIKLSVFNTGEEIPVDQEAELFKPFSRLGKENSTISGVGLSLAYAKLIIKEVGGSIGYQRHKKGPEFWMIFPYLKQK